MGLDLAHTLNSIAKLALRAKRRSEEMTEEKNRKTANEIIDSVLNQVKDKEAFLATLDSVGRDIIDYIIAHENEDNALIVLENIEDVNKEDQFGNTYLTIACLEHKIKVIEKLLAVGADPNHQTNPLLKALEKKNKENPTVLKLFINYHVDLKKTIQGKTLEEAIRSFEDENLNEILDKAVK